MHRLAAVTVSMRLVHKNAQTSTHMHQLAAITVNIHLVHKNAQTSTRMHCLAAIIVSIHLTHAHTNKHIHAQHCRIDLENPSFSCTHTCIYMHGLCEHKPHSCTRHSRTCVHCLARMTIICTAKTKRACASFMNTCTCIALQEYSEKECLIHEHIHASSPCGSYS
jgi:hypothetical protein